MPLSLRLYFCAAACALTLSCSGDRAPSAFTPAPTATSAIAALADSLPRSIPFTVEETATPVPTATMPAEPSVAPVVATPGSAGAPAPTATPKPAARPAPVTLQVTLDTRDQTFEPHQIHGNFDDTVSVTLKGSDERHSFTVPILGIDQVVDKDQTVVVSFVLPLALGGPTAEGTFPFYCRFHGSPTTGMHGFLIFH